MERKQRDYILLLVLMILSFISYNILGKVYALGTEPTVVEIISTVILIAWYVILYRVTSNFYPHKWIRISYASLLVFQFAINAWVIMQVSTSIQTLVVTASIAYLTNLVGFSVVFFILLRDTFLHKHNLVYSLLGASNIYFMIPIIFCYVYCLVAVQNPLLVNADLQEMRTLLFNCFDYSWYVIAGIDYPKEIGEVIQSIAILESITANLFIVFIIGRLMIR